MSYLAIQSDNLYPNWYQVISSAEFNTEKKQDEAYETLGSFSQGTNWEKVFKMGSEINKELKLTEQEVIDDIADFRKERKKQ